MKIKKYGMGVLTLVTVLLFTGCGQKTDTVVKKAETEQEVKIPITFLIDAATNEKNNEDLVNAFNEVYEGQYEVDVEWVPYTAGEYRSYLKRWNVEDELPAIITDVCFSPSFYQLMVNDSRLTDLSPYLKADEEWSESFDQEVLKACMENDGSLYVCPTSSNCFSYSGIFYNRELLKKAGYDSFPDTWEEFFRCCRKLKETGITPLGLHTGGTAWTPMLFATAYLGRTKEGQAFLNQRLPKNYDTEEMYDMVEMLKELFEYGNMDGLYQDFDVPYRQFVNEKTAMLPNGFWMLLQFQGEWAEKIGFAPFPGNVMIASPQSSSWGIVSGYPKEIQDGAAAFLKFRTMETRRQAEEFLKEEGREMSSLERDYIQVVKNGVTVIPNYQLQWNPILQEEVFLEELPKLLRQTIDSKEFIQAMNDSVKRYQEEQ